MLTLVSARHAARDNTQRPRRGPARDKYWQHMASRGFWLFIVMRAVS